ncbi:MAG: BlaI/MecI/CopY family transcriptional regulator [Phycisphaerae bacterium]|nr:BlaI/MecI/CopY family transcriptional regulator [Phycisphaerae bacterium]
MHKKPGISEAEWEVMKVLWGKSPQSSNAIVAILEGKRNWQPKTIRTLINRLVSKNAVGFEKDGRQYNYYPLLNEQECIQAETRSLIDRIRGKAIKPLLATFLEEESLSPEDIAELKEILENRT